MNFGSALEALSQGFKVFRAGWRDEADRPTWIQLDGTGDDQYLVDSALMPWDATHADLLAKDWETHVDEHDRRLTRTLTHVDYIALKKRLALAVARGEEKFQYDGVTLLTAYARYLVEMLGYTFDRSVGKR